MDSDDQTPPPGRVIKWAAGARPRTLGASAIPVLVGTTVAAHVSAWRTVALFVVALGFQAGVNYVNDYFDGVRGVDTAERQGPLRLTASGLASPRAVATAAALCIVAAIAAGLTLAFTGRLLLIPIGVLALLGTLLYSGGPKPYGSLGLGEVFVFVFFGLAATVGSTYAQDGTAPAAAWWAAVPMGLLAVAILMANNLRDIPTDEASGKLTLAVRLGDRRARFAYAGVVVAAVAVLVVGVGIKGLPRDAVLPLAITPFIARPFMLAATAHGRDLIKLLTSTALFHAAFGVLLAVGLIVARHA